jgi:hypothetical protein
LPLLAPLAPPTGLLPKVMTETEQASASQYSYDVRLAVSQAEEEGVVAVILLLWLTVVLLWFVVLMGLRDDDDDDDEKFTEDFMGGCCFSGL